MHRLTAEPEDYSPIWRAAQTAPQLACRPDEYESAVRYLQLLEVDRERGWALLGAPNVHAQHTVQTRLMPLIEMALATCVRHPLKLLVVIRSPKGTPRLADLLASQDKPARRKRRNSKRRIPSQPAGPDTPTSSGRTARHLTLTTREDTAMTTRPNPPAQPADDDLFFRVLDGVIHLIGWILRYWARRTRRQPFVGLLYPRRRAARRGFAHPAWAYGAGRGDSPAVHPPDAGLAA